jgi:anti-sigma factor RsiW
MSETMQVTGHLDPDQLTAFVDNELSATEVNEVQRHLPGCHPCAMRVLSTTGLKAATARASVRYAAPPEALARLTAQLHSPGRKRTARPYSFPAGFPASFPTIAWTALAAGVLLAVSLIGWRQTHRANALSAELLDQHLATLSSGTSPQVLSTDRHTVKPWFQGKLPFSFNLPAVLPPDTTLKGADLTYLDGQPAALLLFTIHKHEVSLFVTQRSGLAIPINRSDIRAGFDICYASTPELRIVAVSDVNPSDLQVLVSAFVQAQ